MVVTERNNWNEFARPIQRGLFIVASISVVCGLLHAIFPERFDEKTAMFLAIAVAALVIHQVTKFKAFGIEFEKKVNQLEAAFSDLEKDVGPGSKSAVVPIATTPLGAVTITGRDARTVDPNDPNKGQFGGSSEANRRKLTASIERDAGPRSSRCRVNIKIVSTDPAQPLTGKVKLYLHPTFGRWSSYELDTRGGVAEDDIVSYGAFTIGAEADRGKTRLELDLMDIPGGTKRFYEV